MIEKISFGQGSEGGRTLSDKVYLGMRILAGIRTYIWM